MRILLMLAAAALAACAPPPKPPPEPAPKADLTKEPAYAEALERLGALTREGQQLFDRGQRDQAAARITESQPLVNRLLAATRPTLAAMEAVSDSDQLYCRMLLANRHYGWARLLFQKDQTRWRLWKPQTSETARRMKLAEAGIAECDRRLRE